MEMRLISASHSYSLFLSLSLFFLLARESVSRKAERESKKDSKKEPYQRRFSKGALRIPTRDVKTNFLCQLISLLPSRLSSAHKLQAIAHESYHANRPL